MDLDSFFYILVGSTLGLILRFSLKFNFKKKISLYLNNTLIVNILASLFLGIFLAFSTTNKNILLLLYVGFLGSLSTFSSFIYQLFSFIQKRKYLNLIIYYIEALLLTFIFFCLGYFITLIFVH